MLDPDHLNCVTKIKKERPQMIIGIRNQNVDKSPHLIYTVEVGDDIQPDLKHKKFVESSQYLRDC